MVKRRCVLLSEAGQSKSATSWLHFRSEGILYLEDAKNVKEQKGHMSRSIGMFSQRYECYRHFVGIVPGLVFPVGGLLFNFDHFP